MATPFERSEVAEIFDTYPAPVRGRLLRLRELVFDTAATTEGVGDLDETLKWGEPAYLTVRPQSGTTIRMDSKGLDHYALYVHCQTDLVRRVGRSRPELNCVGNREVAFRVEEAMPEDAVREFVAAALTYKLRRRS